MERADAFGFWEAIVLATVDEELRRLPLAHKLGWVEPIKNEHFSLVGILSYYFSAVLAFHGGPPKSWLN